MNTVVIDGVTYTKASVLAKKFRYTTDYVGQLCRSQRVDAQLVGRSWYVSEISLEQLSKKRIEAIRKDEILLKNNDIEESESEPIKVLSPLSKNTKKMLHSATSVEDTQREAPSVRYESDSVDLLPVKRITPIIPITADATELSVTSISSPATVVSISDNRTFLPIISADKKPKNLSFTRPPEVALSGNIKVEAVAVPVPKESVLAPRIARPSIEKPIVRTPLVSNAPQPHLVVREGTPLNFTPSTIVAIPTSGRSSYAVFASVLLIVSSVLLFATFLLDVEVQYEGMISSINFRFNQTAFVNFFENF